MEIKLEDIKFKINRSEGQITGFTLSGAGNTDAESYCLSFVTAQALKKASIEFDNGKIIFKHGGIGLDEANPNFGLLGESKGGDFSAEISPEDSEQLVHLLNGSGPYSDTSFAVRLKTGWSKGFILYTIPDTGL